MSTEWYYLGIMKVPKQKKIGVRPNTHKLFKDVASDTRRSMAEVAQIAIESYWSSIREQKPASAVTRASH